MFIGTSFGMQYKLYVAQYIISTVRCRPWHSGAPIISNGLKFYHQKLELVAINMPNEQHTSNATSEELAVQGTGLRETYNN